MPLAQSAAAWTIDWDRLEASVLTVNYDPGRGVKYLGSSLIVIGIFTMFYMRAYFFGPRRQPGVT